MKEGKSILGEDKYRILKETIEDNEVIGIFGKRGSGKSAAGYTILENSPKENAYVVGLGEEYWQLIPDTIIPLQLDIQTLEDLPWHAAIFVDEAAQHFYAHDSGKPLSKLISKLEMDARKKDQLIIFATHTMRKFLIGAILDMDAIIFKQPSILHAKFDRKEIVGMVKTAKREFDKILVEGKSLTSREKKKAKAKYAYLVSEDYEGMIEIPLPSFWSDELSNAVAPDVSEDEAPMPIIETDKLVCTELPPFPIYECACGYVTTVARTACPKCGGLLKHVEEEKSGRGKV